MKIELISQENAAESVKPLLAEVQQKYGFVPNTYGVFSHSPLAVKAYLQLTGLIADHSGLTPQEQQAVMLSVSVENGCEYCVAAHTVVAGMYKTPADAVEAIRSGAAPADARLGDLPGPGDGGFGRPSAALADAGRRDPPADPERR